ncbi:MAG: anthranilate phosphoribosyltransferase [Micropruina sp.]|uniref:anthranilate phosphoribosyltransferase n=1 Tax=Micropruina sp. TaxID=2737536 RepID=UPI0039E3F9E3
MGYTWPDVLTGLIAGEDLSSDAASWAMDEILAGNATDVQLAGFLVALRAKGETVEEIAGLAESMRDRATPITLSTEAVDVVGSGGDRANTVNVSTMAAVVAAGAGAKVVKHGNRAASSACGAADVLEALGVALNVKPEDQPAVLAQAGIVFLFAPLYHPSLRHAGTARRELGIQTPFNFLGPLTNPARPVAQAVGIANQRMAALVAGVLARRGTRGLVFHGDDGLDELTTTTTSDIWLIRDGLVRTTSLDPAELGLAPASHADLVGGDVAHNAAVVRRVFAGETGPVRDIVVLNAAAALLAYHQPSLDRDVAEQLAEHVTAAAAAIDSGAASAVLDSWVEATRRAVASA